jgi:hypothetical protein
MSKRNADWCADWTSRSRFHPPLVSESVGWYSPFSRKYVQSSGFCATRKFPCDPEVSVRSFRAVQRVLCGEEVRHRKLPRLCVCVHLSKCVRVL